MDVIMEIYLSIWYAQRFQTILKVVSFVGKMTGSQNGTVPSVTLKPIILFPWSGVNILRMSLNQVLQEFTN